MGAAGQPKGGKSIINETNSSIVFIVEHRNSHSQPSRPRVRRSLAGV